MNINKMDKVIISSEDVDNLFQWRDNHKDYVRNFKSVMTNGVIELNGEVRQAFQDDGICIRHTIYTFDKQDNFKVYEIHWNKETKTVMQIFNKLENGLDLVEYNQSIISLHASLMAYMEYYSDKKEYVDVVRETSVKNKASVKNSSKKKKRIKISRKVYRVNINQDATIVDKRRYERYMEQWSVRGHYRTYKNGKKVWIKPQVRGKGNSITPKEYEM